LAGHPAQAGNPLRAELVYATKDFGYWMTYAGHNRGAGPATVNANIAKYVAIRSDLPSGARVGHLAGLMHLMNEPNGYRFHMDSFTNARAVETIRWLFGSNPHTPIVRVVWTLSPVGWSITRATFLRLS
jgi:hypothetical protein